MHRNLDRRSLLQQLADFNEHSFMFKRLIDVTFKCTPEKTLLSLYLSVSKYTHTHTHTHTHIYMYIWSIKIRKPFFPTKKMQGNDIKKKSEQLHLFPCLDVFHTYPPCRVFHISIFRYSSSILPFFTEQRHPVKLDANTL